MVKIHGLILPSEEPSKVRKDIDGDLRAFMSKQKKQKQEEIDTAAMGALRGAIEPALVQQALLRLIVQHDLPISAVQWPELHTLLYTINPEAKNSIWTSHQSATSHIAATFNSQKETLKQLLQQSQSLIHLTTDTWHSPNHKELQSITAHWIDASGTRQKALLNLPELLDGHAGVEVAPLVLSTLEEFGIEDRLGYITTDNHGANDTMCRLIEEELPEFHTQERRLRCIGHIINIAIQAFLFAKNKDAVEVALEAAEAQPHSALEEEITAASKVDTTGWIQIAPLQKILTFVTILRRSDRLYNAFKAMANKAIRPPNDTRWNSYLFTFEDALEVRASYQAFVVNNPQLSECELTVTDWQLVEQTVQFLLPFKEATKRCEGDYVTLDKVQIELDSLSYHFKEQSTLHKANPSFTQSIITGWYAFDKFYKLIDQSAAYTASVLLHPSYRRAYLQASWHKDWIEPGIGRARALWQRYKKEEEADDIIDSEHLSQHQRWLATIQAKQKRLKGGAQDEFDRFINAPSDIITVSVLDWWLEPSQRRTYPQLSHMAIDILSALAMSAESERVFSAARRTLPWTRARLGALLVLQLECLKNWHRTGLISDQFIINDSGYNHHQRAKSPIQASTTTGESTSID